MWLFYVHFIELRENLLYHDVDRYQDMKLAYIYI